MAPKVLRSGKFPVNNGHFVLIFKGNSSWQPQKKENIIPFSNSIFQTWKLRAFTFDWDLRTTNDVFSGLFALKVSTLIKL